MAYKVLYRKYRPQDFNNLLGQDKIKRILVDSIVNNKISHAYLFSGPRGTGKTSTAKIFARTINCEKPNNGVPCGKCLPCLNYQESPDIIEIDAASNNGVDEIRELRDNANILPSMSKYKIYIIDEVHMLSQSAWNAFLKILEEPPKHIIFILATTEIQKVPITILSRCQRFNFEKISDEIIKQNIMNISKNEKIKITEEAASDIALLADGGMRDALSILDQLSKENEEITTKTIEETFGVINTNIINNIFDALTTADISGINRIFDDYANKGLDCNILISKLLDYIYKLETSIITGTESAFDVRELKEMANNLVNCYNKRDAMTLIKISLLSFMKNGSVEKNISKEQTQQEEKITQPKIDKEIISQEIISEQNTEDNKITSETENEKQEFLSNPLLIEEIKKIRLNNVFVNPSKSEKDKFKKSWEIFINKEIEKNNVELLSLVEDINIEVASPTNILFSNKSPSTCLLFNQNLNTIENEYYKVRKEKIKFICLKTDEWEIEKKEFIKNKSKKYEYIDEPKSGASSETFNSALDIFDQEIIELK